eukprot:superscaffoldBa00007648_g22718
MKLGLLVVLAVAVLVPSLSEGRIVSRCELKDKLGEAIVLPRRLQRFKERILTIVICEAERRSRLNTGLVRVFGKRKTTTVRPTTTTLSTPPGNETITKPPIKPPIKPMTTKPIAPELTKATVAGTPRGRASDTGGRRQKREADKISAESETTGDESDMVSGETDTIGEEAETTGDEVETIGEEAETTGDEVETIGKEGDTIGEEAETTEMDESLEEMFNEEESKFDEEEMMEDDNRMGDEDEESDEEDIENEQELEEGGKRKKRFVPRSKPKRKPKRKWKPWSLGFYGLFQLSDSTFCDSGYRWTRNVCKTSCKAFTDDNIEDDIDCFVKSRYWLFLLKSARRCYRARNFFNKCK